MTTEHLTPERPAAAPPQSDALAYLRIGVVAIAMVLVVVSLFMGVQAFGSDLGPSCGGG